jgi:hypothetical protein
MWRRHRRNLANVRPPYLTLQGYPEGHPNAITKVEDLSTLSDSERTRVVETEDGTYVCRDKVRGEGHCRFVGHHRM